MCSAVFWKSQQCNHNRETVLVLLKITPCHTKEMLRRCLQDSCFFLDWLKYSGEIFEIMYGVVWCVVCGGMIQIIIWLVLRVTWTLLFSPLGSSSPGWNERNHNWSQLTSPHQVWPHFCRQSVSQTGGGQIRFVKMKMNKHLFCVSLRATVRMVGHRVKHTRWIFVLNFLFSFCF